MRKNIGSKGVCVHVSMDFCGMFLFRVNYFISVYLNVAERSVIAIKIKKQNNKTKISLFYILVIIPKVSDVSSSRASFHLIFASNILIYFHFFVINHNYHIHFDVQTNESII